MEDNCDVSLRDLSSSRSLLDEELGIASMVTETLRLNMHIRTKRSKKIVKKIRAIIIQGIWVL